jgi:hypothetical protein
MPPVFEKESEYESLHPFPDTVLAFLLKKEVSAGPTGYPGRNYTLAINFTGFTTSRSGQKIINDYGKTKFGTPLYFADAIP